MQTFLPYKNFNKSAQTLDNKRLNKQILEGYQILKVINNPDPKAAWRNHPAVKMWRGHEYALWDYIAEMVEVADERGIKTDKNVENLHNLRNTTEQFWSNEDPSWYNDDVEMTRITMTHKANLFIKDSGYYHEFEFAVRNENNVPCCATCSYYWPTHMEN